MKKKGLEFGFSWIFAIIVGSAILFLALFAVTRLVDTERRVSDTFVASELNNLIHPIETNLEDSKYVKIDFVDETRVYNECETFGNFGKQMISTSSKIGIGKEWGRRSVKKSSFNKYLFSREVEEGKELNVIVKPFSNPFKVGDLTIMYSGNYCFVNPISDIKDELDDLSGGGNIDLGIYVATNPGNCSQGQTIVCFNVGGCDVNVFPDPNIDRGIVEHNTAGNQEEVYYEGDLIYGAIFAEKEVYECQLKRLMKRTSELGHVYLLKAGFLTGQGCSNNLQGDLISLTNEMNNVNNSQEFVSVQVQDKIKDLGRKNDELSRCKVF